MSDWQVIVSNIGTVFTGAERKARREFNAYVKACKARHGRAAGESVTLIGPDDIAREYTGRLHRRGE